MSKNIGKITLDHLIQLGVVYETGVGIDFTNGFRIIQQKYVDKFVNGGSYFKELQTLFPNENEKQLAERCIHQSSILALMDMMGGGGNKEEIINATVMIIKLHEIQLQGSV